MFLHLSAILFTGGMYPSMHWGRTPPGQTYPSMHCPLPRRLLQRTVRILLECILVVDGPASLAVDNKPGTLTCSVTKRKNLTLYLTMKQWFKGSLVNNICEVNLVSKQDLLIMVTCSSNVVQWTDTMLSKFIVFSQIHWIEIVNLETQKWVVPYRRIAAPEMKTTVTHELNWLQTWGHILKKLLDNVVRCIFKEMTTPDSGWFRISENTEFVAKTYYLARIAKTCMKMKEIWPRSERVSLVPPS